MNPLIYRQLGGVAPEVAPMDPMGAQAPVDPMMAQGMQPAPAPEMTMAAPPPPPVRKTFAEKVQEAKAMIESGRSSVPQAMMKPAGMIGYDGQGQGPIYGDATMSPAEVGPDVGEDTVDAKLTPGEYVLNKEAVDMFGPQIEQMNQAGLEYRNAGGKVGNQTKMEKMMSIMGNASMPMAARQAASVHYKNMGGPIYRQTGGFANQFQDWRAANPGLLGAIGQDIKTEALNPGTAGTAVSDLRTANAKSAVKSKDDLKLFTDYSRSAQKALLYVNDAVDALDALNAANVKANAAYATSAVLPVINQGTSALNQVRENAVLQYMRDWGSKPDNAKSYEAYKLLEAAVTELTTTALKAQGPGPKTDFDFVVAARSTADLTATPTAIKKSLERLVVNANEEIKGLGGEVPVVNKNSIDVESEDAITLEETPSNVLNTEVPNNPLVDIPQPANDKVNESVVEMPRTVVSILIGKLHKKLKLKALKEWAERNGHGDDVIVSDGEDEATIGEIKKALEK